MQGHAPGESGFGNVYCGMCVWFRLYIAVL